jgi:hypothetical protein
MYHTGAAVVDSFERDAVVVEHVEGVDEVAHIEGDFRFLAFDMGCQNALVVAPVGGCG